MALKISCDIILLILIKKQIYKHVCSVAHCNLIIVRSFDIKELHLCKSNFYTNKYLVTLTQVIFFSIKIIYFCHRLQFILIILYIFSALFCIAISLCPSIKWGNLLPSESSHPNPGEEASLLKIECAFLRFWDELYLPFWCWGLQWSLFRSQMVQILIY